MIIDLFATNPSKFSRMPVDYTVNGVNVTNPVNVRMRSNGTEARLTVGLPFWRANKPCAEGPGVSVAFGFDRSPVKITNSGFFWNQPR